VVYVAQSVAARPMQGPGRDAVIFERAAANFGAARVFHFLAAIPRFAVTAAADEDPGLAEASLLVARKRPL
jgi:hypothetical protein